MKDWILFPPAEDKEDLNLPHKNLDLDKQEHLMKDRQDTKAFLPFHRSIDQKTLLHHSFQKTVLFHSVSHFETHQNKHKYLIEIPFHFLHELRF